ncbi:ubiquitin-specific protease ubp1 [Coemansia sp. RSA 988]|nr:ubiquitin-specific protease ubp1 [Coemansia sp. RSA 988]
MLWYHILGIYLAVVLGLIALAIVRLSGLSRLLLSRRRGEGKRPFWVLVWRWLRYVARCGRRRKKRAKPVEDRREERRALRRKLREEAEEWVTEWIEKIVELGDDLLEADFGDDDDDDDFFAGDEQESDEDGSDSNGAESADERQVIYGLVNTGNSCFFNSVLQALASAEYLQNYLTSTLERMDEINDGSGAGALSMPLTEALWETMTDLNAVVGRDSAFQPFAVMAALGSSRLNDQEQQDAQEAFQLISAALSEERQVFAELQTPSLLAPDLVSILSQADAQKPHIFSVPRGLESVGTKGLSRVRALMKLATLAGVPADDQGLAFGRRQIPQNPFVGLMASRLSCVKCGYTEAVRHFSFDNVSLPLPLVAACTLDQALRKYTSLEEIVDFQCCKCTLNQTLRELIAEIKEATRWLADNPEYDVGEKEDSSRAATDSCETPAHATAKSRRKAARAEAAWRRVVFDDPGNAGSSTSDSDSDCNNKEWRQHSTHRKKQYPLDPAEQIANPTRPLPPPELVNVPRILWQLRADANAVANALRTDVQTSLPNIPMRKAYNQLSTKQVAFAKMPPCLFFHLSRSTYTPDGYPVKNPCHVRFPEYLDLSPYTTTGALRLKPELSMIDAEIRDSSSNNAANKAYLHPGRRQRDALEALGPGANLQNSYRLQAVVVHIGSHSYGHFITYRRKPRAPVRSGVNTPRYRSGSVASLPLYSTGPSTTQVLEKRHASTTPQPLTESSEGVRKRRIVGGSATSDHTYLNANESIDNGCSEHFSTLSQTARPKRSWRVTDAMTAEWYLISDEDVQAVSLAEVLNSNPYLLIYERIEGPQTTGYVGTPGIIPSLTNLRNLARRSTSAQPLSPNSASQNVEILDVVATPVSDGDETPLINGEDAEIKCPSESDTPQLTNAAKE